MRSDDPLDDGVSDLVVDQPVLGTADEELVLTERRERTSSLKQTHFLLGAGIWPPPYLYVDVVFALGDDLDVGVMDGLLVVLDTSRPIGCRAQHLSHTEREEGYDHECDRADVPRLTFTARAV